MQQRYVASVFILGLTLGSRPAWSDPRSLEQRIHVDAGDPCPSAAEVAAETSLLTPADRRTVLDELVDVTLQHQAGMYRVLVSTKNRTAARTFSESERDCNKRARFAAVFIVLVLILPDEPEVSAPPPAAPPAPPPRAPPVVDTVTPARPAAPRAARRLVRLELAGVVEGAPVLAATAATSIYAGRLQALVGRGPVAAAVGVLYAAPASFQLDRVRAVLTRAGVSAGVRGRVDVGESELALELAAVLELERVAGETATAPGSDAGLQIGARAAVMFAWPSSASVQPFGSVSAQWSPEPHQLVTLPRGVIGTLPRLWLGASVGVALAL